MTGSSVCRPPSRSKKLDAVTGATLSSNAIKEAAKDVFRQAESKETPVFASGSGTKSDPYLIRTAAQLQAFLPQPSTAARAMRASTSVWMPI